MKPNMAEVIFFGPLSETLLNFANLFYIYKSLKSFC